MRGLRSPKRVGLPVTQYQKLRPMQRGGGALEFGFRVQARELPGGAQPRCFKFAKAAANLSCESEKSGRIQVTKRSSSSPSASMSDSDSIYCFCKNK